MEGRRVVISIEWMCRKSLQWSEFHIWASLKSACNLTTTAAISNGAVDKDDEDLGIYAKKLKHRDWLTSTEIVKLLQPIKDPLLALRIFNRAAQRSDYVPSEAVYSAVINKLAYVGQFDSIELLLERMKREHCECTDDFFFNLIKIFAHKAGNHNKGLRILFGMRDFDCWPTVRTFNFVLNILVCAKQFEMVHKLYLRAPEMAVSPDACSFNILIKALCRLGKVDAAYSLLSEMNKQGCPANEITYGTLMDHLCKEGKAQEALDLFENMTKDGCHPDTVTFNIVISCLSKQGKIKEAVEFLDSMESKGHNPTSGSYHAVLYGILHNQMFTEAKAIIHRMLLNRCFPSFSSYKTLIAGLCNEGLVDDAVQILEQMLKQGFVPRMGTWNSLLGRIIMKNCLDDSFRLVKDICRESTTLTN